MPVDRVVIYHPKYRHISRISSDTKNQTRGSDEGRLSSMMCTQIFIIETNIDRKLLIE
jgi:hypothetical protein